MIIRHSSSLLSALVAFSALASAVDCRSDKPNTQDPFEQAVGTDQKTAMSLGGAMGAPMTAWQYDFNILPIGQQLWLQHLTTFKTFPPLQAPVAYNLDSVMKEVQSKGSHGE